MITLPNTKLESAAATKDCRYYLNSIYFDSEKSRAVATDGHIMAIVPAMIGLGNPVDPIVEPSGYIPGAALKSQRKANGKKLDILYLQTDDQHVTNSLTGERFERLALNDAKFPDYERVIPNETRNEITFCINPELLTRLSDALHDVGSKFQGVRLRIGVDADGKYDSSAIRVEPTHGTTDGRIGVLMTMRDPAK